MMWSLRIGRFAGIDVRVHATFVLLLAWFGFLYWSQTGTIAGVLQGLSLILALFLCVLLHEYGHALAARRYGIGTRDITLLPFGGVAMLARMPREPRHEIVVALAGPAVNFAIAAALALLLGLDRGTALPGFSLGHGGFVSSLLTANLVLAVFNLLPAFPMDGGRVLRAILSLRMERARATRWAATLGQALALGLGYLGFTGNPFLLLIAVFVWVAAGAEANAVAVESRLARRSAGRAMTTDLQALTPEDALSRAVDLTLAGTQRHFPVLDRGAIVGVLPQERLLQALRALGPDAPVGAAMQRAATADVATPLETLLERLRDEDGAQIVLVTRRGRLAGLVDLDTITELLRVETALRGRGR